MLDREKLTKVLMLTQSDQDGEALAAIRAANAMLARSGQNWEGFLRAPGSSPGASGGPTRGTATYARTERPAGPAGWKKNARGNWVRFAKGQGVFTVFERNGDWTWVHDGQFGPKFDDVSDAVADCEESFDLD